MRGDYPAKYVWIRDVTGCLCPQEQKGQQYCLTADMLGEADGMNLDEFIFNFHLFLP